MMLANKVAVITGAAQGIGLAVARLMLRHGARVNMVDVSEQVGRAACRNLQEEFNRHDVIFTTTDVTDSEQLTHQLCDSLARGICGCVRQAFQETKDTFGGIDIVCNNAGIGEERQWKKMIAINTVAVIEGTFLGIEFLSSRRGGRGGVIINVSSMGGIYPMSFAPTYCASKHGVVGFSRSMVNCYLTDNVRVNCVCPEFTETRMVLDMMTSFGQLAQPVQPVQQAQQAVTSIGLLSPEKVAEGILELAADESKVGAVMTITLKRGVDYYRLPGDQKPSKASKL